MLTSPGLQYPLAKLGSGIKESRILLHKLQNLLQKQSICTQPGVLTHIHTQTHTQVAYT